MFKKRKLLFADTSTIWESTDGCADQYRWATALYLLPMLAHAYNTIIIVVLDHQDIIERLLIL